MSCYPVPTTVYVLGHRKHMYSQTFGLPRCGHRPLPTDLPLNKLLANAISLSSCCLIILFIRCKCLPHPHVLVWSLGIAKVYPLQANYELLSPLEPHCPRFDCILLPWFIMFTAIEIMRSYSLLHMYTALDWRHHLGNNRLWTTKYWLCCNSCG